MPSVASFLSRLALGSESKRFSDALRVYKSGKYAEAFAALLPLAKSGHAESEALLANMYLNGEGIAVDLNEAARWTQLAAEQGDPVAQHNLGLMYHDGKGVTADLSESARWTRLAAEQGVAQARHNLGVMYEDGTGVSQDISEALRWYRLAAQFGNAGAQINLANCFHDGCGVVLDESLAAWWISLAADQDTPDAQLNLGVRYLNGIGISQNLIQAFFWFDLAAKAGSPDAAHYLTNMAQSMSPEHLNDAQAQCESSTWRPKSEVESRIEILKTAAFQNLDAIKQVLGEEQYQKLKPTERKIPSTGEVILEETRGVQLASVFNSIKSRLAELEMGIDTSLTAFRNEENSGAFPELPAALAVTFMRRLDDVADVDAVLAADIDEEASASRALLRAHLCLIGAIEAIVDENLLTALLRRFALRQALRSPAFAKLSALHNVLLPLLPW